nr:hypothetical protein [Methanosarcina horonobensis]
MKVARRSPGSLRQSCRSERSSDPYFIEVAGRFNGNTSAIAVAPIRTRGMASQNMALQP